MRERDVVRQGGGICAGGVMVSMFHLSEISLKLTYNQVWVVFNHNRLLTHSSTVH